jgi:hypothetical protein
MLESILSQKNIFINNIMFINIFFIIIFILIFIYIYYEKKNENFYSFDTQNYKNIMLNNDKKKLYKIGIAKDIKIYREDCFDKCDSKSCIKLDQQQKMLDKCLKCNMQKNKCFNKSIIGGLCDDCNIENIEDKSNCYEIGNFGCVNPNNLNNTLTNIGIDPYYIEVPDNNPNSSFDKKCVFCWNILDNI